MEDNIDDRLVPSESISVDFNYLKWTYIDNEADSGWGSQSQESRSAQIDHPSRYKSCPSASKGGEGCLM